MARRTRAHAPLGLVLVVAGIVLALGMHGAGAAATAAPAPRKFIIMASQRTGSTLLSLLLNEHPDVHCMQEVFLPGAYNISVKNVPNSYRIWTLHRTVLEDAFAGRLVYVDKKTLLSDGGPGKAAPLARGFKHMYNHMLPRIREEFFRWAASNDLHVIHLHRNPIESFVSVRVAEKNSVWHSVDFNTRPAVVDPDLPIVLNISRLERSLKHLSSEFNFFRDRLQMTPRVAYMLVDYKELLTESGRQAALDRIWTFLGVPPFDRAFEPASVPLRRLSTKTCRQRVANWEEVQTALEGKFPEYVHSCSMDGDS